MRNLKVLFGKMTKSYKKYGDPTEVLKSITDDYGKPVEIGEEKDIGEFNDTFLSSAGGIELQTIVQRICSRIEDEGTRCIKTITICVRLRQS